MYKSFSMNIHDVLSRKPASTKKVEHCFIKTETAIEN